jgi:hypothetical protein
LGVGSTVGAPALAVAAAIGIGIAVSQPESPWCDDVGGVCPDEVLYNDRIYVVECTEHLVGFEKVRLEIPAGLRDEQLWVRYHSGDRETERRAWTVHGVDPAELIVLDERDTAPCSNGGPAFAVAHGGGVSALEAAATLQRLSESGLPQPSREEPTDADAARAAIVKAFTEAFTSSLPVAERRAHVQDSDELGPYMERTAARYRGVVTLQTVTVSDIVFLDIDRAAVTFTMTFEDRPPLTQAGTAVLDDGEWKVSRDTFCTLILLGGGTCP